MPDRLSDRSILLTGAAGGIGRELVKAFLGAGARVAATDVDASGLQALRALHAPHAQSGRLDTQVLDIADSAACEGAVDAASRRFGSLDILVNNAAMGMQLIREDCMTNLIGIEEVEPARWDRFVTVNLSGAWYLTRAAVPAMKSRRWGRIITVTTSFFTMLRGRFQPYGPAKAALEAMSAGHAQEFDGTGVTVNVVVPGGPADTPMVPASSGYRRQDLIPPSVMAGPMLWLCSRDADAVTGKRYIAAQWDDGAGIAAARKACEAPIGWPDLAASPIWPGGRPGQ